MHYNWNGVLTCFNVNRPFFLDNEINCIKIINFIQIIKLTYHTPQPSTLTNQQLTNHQKQKPINLWYKNSIGSTSCSSNVQNAY